MMLSTYHVAVLACFIILLGVAGVLWLIFRSGPKRRRVAQSNEPPTPFAYPGVTTSAPPPAFARPIFQAGSSDQSPVYLTVDAAEKVRRIIVEEDVGAEHLLIVGLDERGRYNLDIQILGIDLPPGTEYGLQHGVRVALRGDALELRGLMIDYSYGEDVKGFTFDLAN